jgi:Lhr-like helicase
VAFAPAAERLLQRLGRVTARETEIHHAYAIIVTDHHVVGFDVAVHEADLVRGRKTERNRL